MVLAGYLPRSQFVLQIPPLTDRRRSMVAALRCVAPGLAVACMSFGDTNGTNRTIKQM